MKKTLIGIIFLMFLAQACGPLTPMPAPTTVSTVAPTISTSTPLSMAATPMVTAEPAVSVKRLGGVPCPDSAFTCVTLTVPLNHFDSKDSRTIKVVFAVLPASGERKGMFVTATGGPGSSGISSADDYTTTLDASITEHFDIVYFDQRGVGQSGGLQCTNAAAAFYRRDWSANTPQEEAAMVNSARTFSDDCVAEMGSPEILPYLGTDQSVEDLDSFRQAVGDEKIWMYGESYGTQYSQTYAATHPGHLAGLILDGTVDLTLSSQEYAVKQTQAFDDVLKLTLEACNANEFCAESMGGGDAVAAYEKLAERLRQSPQPFDFPLPSGGVARRTFSLADLENAVTSYLYSESTRMLFLRALQAYSRNEDLAPMARILYDALVLDPETLAAIPDPTFSDAMYYAVECQDYSFFSGTPDERAAAFIRAGNPVDTTIHHFSTIFYGDLPCVFWPAARQDPARPAPLTADGIPTLVLGATADPATPVSNGQAVFSRLSDGYLVTQEGGPHVIYGRGHACIDDLVMNFLVKDQMPPNRETTCAGEVTKTFVPLAPFSAAEFKNPLEALRSVDDEIYYLPEYYYWDAITPTSVGCPFGGTLSFEKTETGDSFSLDNCSFTNGFSLTGSGSNNSDDGSFKLEVNVTGLKAGSLTYTRAGDGNIRVTGTYGGEAVDLSE